MTPSTKRPDRLADAVRERIISGLIPPGASIRQDALAAELGVSKIPLREAFARLEQDGLIVSHANRGFFVPPLSWDEANDVFDLRLKIEPEAVGAASERAGEADVRAAALALELLNAGAQRGEAGALNRAFHLALIQPVRRPVTLQLVERLQVLAERYVVQHLQPFGRTERAAGEHRRLFEAWASRDGAEAARLSAAHIAATLGDLRREIAPG